MASTARSQWPRSTFGHVELLATMIAQLLEKAPVGVTDDALHRPR
ncbi:hypothetical protein ACWDWO_23300 [Actinopolymorpha singaporensis]